MLTQQGLRLRPNLVYVLLCSCVLNIDTARTQAEFGMYMYIYIYIYIYISRCHIKGTEVYLHKNTRTHAHIHAYKGRSDAIYPKEGDFPIGEPYGIHT